MNGGSVRDTEPGILLYYNREDSFNINIQTSVRTKEDDALH